MSCWRLNGVGGSDDCSTSSETNDGIRVPYTASMSVNDSDTADCSESWLNIESVGDSAAEGWFNKSRERGGEVGNVAYEPTSRTESGVNSVEMGGGEKYLVVRGSWSWPV